MRPFRFPKPLAWTWCLLSLVNVVGAAEPPVSPSSEGTRATSPINAARTVSEAPSPIAAAPLVEPLPTDGRNVYRLASAELNGRSDAREIVATAPHGFVCVLPGGTPQTAGRWTSLWTTDGDGLYQGGKPVPLGKARELLAVELAEGAKAFPLRVEGRVFRQVIEHGPGQFVVVLIDPGWLDPADREVKISAATQGDWRIVDRLTGEALGDLRQPFALRVPAGMFRLLDVRSE